MTTHEHRHEHAHRHAHAHGQAHTLEVADFVGSAIAGRSRVLEVGCGRGEVARELAARGFHVTALDIALRDLVDAPGVTFVERDFLAYDDAPFDAIVFTASLHHIAPLSAAVDRAHRMLAPHGLLVADEFDVEAPDAPTLAWYYDTQELLVAAGLYPADRLDDPHPDLVARWQHAHEHDQRLHTGSEMRAAIGERFEIVELARREYLYRYIQHGLPDDARGSAVAAAVVATERRRIAQGLLVPVGLRIVAERGVD